MNEYDTIQKTLAAINSNIEKAIERCFRQNKIVFKVKPGLFEELTELEQLSVYDSLF